MNSTSPITSGMFDSLSGNKRPRSDLSPLCAESDRSRYQSELTLSAVTGSRHFRNGFDSTLFITFRCRWRSRPRHQHAAFAKPRRRTKKAINTVGYIEARKATCPYSPGTAFGRIFACLGSDAEISAATSTKTASTNRLAENVPVRSRTNPTRNGPVKPPKFPMLLIRAKPLAAAVPPRRSAGTAQNTPNMLHMPIAATQSARNDAMGSAKAALAASPADPMNAAIARCHFRSPVRSEWCPHHTIATPIADIPRMSSLVR